VVARRALVVIAGQTQQLPAGDSLAGVAGGASWTEVEIDFGSVPQYSKSFTIVDASVAASSLIMAVQSGTAATSRSADENGMDGLVCNATAGTGQFTLNVFAVPGPVAGKYRVSYVVQ
jgi:hypothetical protein